MRIIGILLAALVLDCILGDPEKLTPIHPVVLMGKGISLLERFLRRIFRKDAEGEFRAGVLLAVILPVATLAVSITVLRILNRVCMPAAIILEILWCWQTLAVKNLRDEAMRVYRCLKTETLDAARKAVARIVGRDTAELSEEGVTKAAVETVAENFSDGIAAPMFYMAIGGAPFALCYKAVNTMDSMVGYKNDRYLYFGRAAAKLDDAANYVPARFAALLLIAAAALTGENPREAARIWKRDRRKHASPNSAQCEAAAAGALEIQLAGPASYFGKVYDKPFIGDYVKPAEPEDIRRICRMELTGSLLCAAVLCALRLLVWCMIV